MIDSVEAAERMVVRWSDGAETQYSWLWVRDHSHDPATLHPVTLQRLVDPLDRDPTDRPLAARLVGDRIEVDWPGVTEPSVLPASFLAALRGADDGGELRDVAEPWDAGSVEVRPHPHASIVGSSDGVRPLLDDLARTGFGLITAAPTTVEAAELVLRRIGYVRETIFGGMWDFTADLARADTAYTALALRPHTDGTYSLDAPGLQLLLCLDFDGDGGETVLVDGFRIADELRSREPDLFDVLATTPVTGRYLGDDAWLEATRPPLRLDPRGRVVQVSYNTADRAPFAPAADGADRLYAAVRAFGRLADDPAFQWRHALAPGEAVLFDNWRLLHGRTAFTGRRHMCGGYVNREDFESRRRVLGGVAQPAGNATGT